MIGVTGAWGWSIVVATIAFWAWSMVLLRKTGAFVRLGGTLTLWLVATFAFGERVASALGDHGWPPPVVIGAAALAFFGVAAAVMPRFRSRLLEVPLHLVIAPQALRIAGGTFLLAAREDLVGWSWALPTAVGDMLVGFSAVVATVAAWKKTRGWRFIALAPIAFAVFDAAASGREGPHMRVEQLQNLGRFPIVLISAFALPLSTLLFVVLAARVWRELRGSVPAYEVAS